MATAGRRGAGERVLEGKHVIGLFMLMLLFSAVFFSLGYVMGRNQYDGQVNAAMKNSRTEEPAYIPKSEVNRKKAAEAPLTDTGTDPAPSDKVWDFSKTAAPPKTEPRLEAPPKPEVAPTATAASSAPKNLNPKANGNSSVTTPVATRNAKAPASAGAPLIPAGALILQVAALTTQDDALDIAGSLQKKHFSAYVAPPQKDKFYRVQVGPFKDQKSADAVKKGLESAGFKAFFVKH